MVGETVVGRDVADGLQAFRPLCRLGVPRIGDAEQVHRLDVVRVAFVGTEEPLRTLGEPDDRFDALAKFTDALLWHLRNPRLLQRSGRSACHV